MIGVAVFRHQFRVCKAQTEKKAAVAGIGSIVFPKCGDRQLDAGDRNRGCFFQQSPSHLLFRGLGMNSEKINNPGLTINANDTGCKLSVI